MSTSDADEPTFYLAIGFGLLCVASFSYLFAGQMLWMGYNQTSFRSYYWIFRNFPGWERGQEDIFAWIHDSFWAFSLAVTGAAIVVFSFISKKQSVQTIGIWMGVFFLALPALTLESFGDILYSMTMTDRNWFTALVFGETPRPIGEDVRLDIGPFTFHAWIFFQWLLFFLVMTVVTLFLLYSRTRKFILKHKYYIVLEILVGSIVLFLKYFLFLSTLATFLTLLFFTIIGGGVFWFVKLGYPSLTRPITHTKLLGGLQTKPTLRTSDGLVAVSACISGAVSFALAIFLPTPTWAVLLGGLVPAFSTAYLTRDQYIVNIKVLFALLGFLFLMELSIFGMLGGYSTIFYSTEGEPDVIAEMTGEWGVDAGAADIGDIADVANPLSAIEAATGALGGIVPAFLAGDFGLVTQLVVTLAFSIGPLMLAVGAYQIARGDSAATGMFTVITGGIVTAMSTGLTYMFPEILTLRTSTIQNTQIFNMFSIVEEDTPKFVVRTIYSSWLLIPLFGLLITVVGVIWAFHHPTTALEKRVVKKAVPEPFRIGGTPGESPIFYGSIIFVAFISLIVGLAGYSTYGPLYWMLPLLGLSMLFMIRKWQMGREWEFCSFGLDSTVAYGTLVGFIALELSTRTLQMAFAYYSLVTYAVTWDIAPVWTEVIKTGIIIPILETAAFSIIFFEISHRLIKHDMSADFKKAETMILAETDDFNKETKEISAKIKNLHKQYSLVVEKRITMTDIRKAVIASDLKSRLDAKEIKMKLKHKRLLTDVESVDHDVVRKSMLIAMWPTALVFGLFHLVARVYLDPASLGVFLSIYLPLYTLGGVIMWGMSALTRRYMTCFMIHVAANICAVVLIF